MSALEVGLLDSVAWREEGRVHVVLDLPALQGLSSGQDVAVRFRDGERRVRRPATLTSTERGGSVTVSAPGPRLAAGLWRIAVRVDDAETFTRVDARLLVRRGQPIALIPGPAPETRMREPEPRPAPRHPTDAARGFAGRVVRGVRRRLGR